MNMISVEGCRLVLNDEQAAVLEAVNFDVLEFIARHERLCHSRVDVEEKFEFDTRMASLHCHAAFQPDIFRSPFAMSIATSEQLILAQPEHVGVAFDAVVEVFRELA